MTESPPEPRPVPVRRYRYSKLRWRVLVHALDAVGAVLMAIWRRLRAAPVAVAPRSILIVQLDHLGDAVLTSPILPRLRAAYPDARIDVLASPSNRAVFAADPNVDRVRVAEKNWFARGPAGWALGSAVWRLGRSLRGERYDLGIDVRGDVLTVLVLALAGIPRRVGWAMGGGGFLLTDVAAWEPGRHEVRSRLALLACLGLPDEDEARVSVGVSDDDRATVARKLRQAWPERMKSRPAKRRANPASYQRVGEGWREGAALHGGQDFVSGSQVARPPHPNPLPRRGDGARGTDPDRLHAGRFGEEAPLLAVHLGAGTAAKRWPSRHWKALTARFLADGWRIVVVGGPDDAPYAKELPDHPDLRDWTGQLAVTQTTALLERADLFIGSDSGPAHLAACAGVPSVILFSGTNRVRQWRPWSRRSLVLRRRVPCRPCHHKTCPLADHPCLAGLGADRVYRAARLWWARLHREEAPHAPM
ncbi:MAG: ADP-heptose:LPS heptosyltransferase [Planctomycetota bacterium]|nr:ADP-heptose:LPS heptosyltransferase [Planctomycetota bacterium]